MDWTTTLNGPRETTTIRKTTIRETKKETKTRRRTTNHHPKQSRIPRSNCPTLKQYILRWGNVKKNR